jgi:putative Mg2+ transporter-C (MgtC) family protein
MEFFTLIFGPFLPYSDAIIRLSVALVLGAIVGTERTLAHRRAGMRTYAIVSLGSAAFIVIGEIVRQIYGEVGIDPLRIASQIVMGVGFLGAGLIIVRGTQINGLTTAAGLWVAATIGMAAGFGLYPLAIIIAMLTLFVFVVLRGVEQEVKDHQG